VIVTTETKPKVNVPAAEDAVPVVRIEPSRGWVALRLAELWQYRELLYFLAWRDVKIRYKQTALGATWAIIQPLFNMVVFSFIFGKLAKIPSDGVPYPIFSYVAQLPWGFFSTALGLSSNSLVGSSNLIKKVYFPRLTIPIATVLSGLVDFGVAFLVLIGLMVYYHIVPTVNIIFLPFFLLLAIVTSLGVGLWFSALNVQYRDVKYVVPFITQLWMYISPVVYPTSLMPAKWKLLYAVNPMAGVIEGFRWALLGGKYPPPGPMMAVSVTAAILILVGGAFYFRRMEKTFADVV
jgi:lipopolysaccharide transport system permease protein